MGGRRAGVVERREAREVRDARRAYAAALADRLADLLMDDDCDARQRRVEARDIVASLALIVPRDAPARLLPEGEGDR